MLKFCFLKNFLFQFCHNQSTIRRRRYVPIAVSLFCFNLFLPNLKILFLSTTSARAQSVSLEICFSSRNWDMFFQSEHNYSLSADMPSSCGISGYRLTTSTTHKIVLAGNFGKERSLFKEAFVYLIYDFTACAQGCRWKPKNADISSV